MQNQNRSTGAPGDPNVPAYLAGADALDEAVNDNREEEEDTLNRTLPENVEGRSEADKEADTRSEDFESFNVDKVDELEKAKEESDGPDAE